MKDQNEDFNYYLSLLNVDTFSPVLACHTTTALRDEERRGGGWSELGHL